MGIETYSYAKDRKKRLSPHFAVGEFASLSGGKLYSDRILIDTDLIGILERLYDYLNCSRIVITSGYRTAAHDRAAGGDGKGRHTKGMAADVNCWHLVKGGEERYHGAAICCALQELGWDRGIGWIAGCAVHIDTRAYRYWFDEQKGCRSIGKDWYAYMAAKGHPVRRPGDVDGDGSVTSTDARLALQAAVGKVRLDAEAARAADLDRDGSVTSTDARQILQKAVK